LVIRKEKKNKLAIKPSEQTEITTRRPYDLWSDIDRLFDSFKSDFDDLFWPWGNRSGLTSYSSTRTPSMDVCDMGDHYEMRVEMPGIPKENVDIQVTPNGVEIEAKCEESNEVKDKTWLRKECSGVSYYRSLELPEELKTDNVEAELKDGILILNLPKIEPKQEYKPKKVQVK
jgi:HSP20 family protein